MSPFYLLIYLRVIGGASLLAWLDARTSKDTVS